MILKFRKMIIDFGTRGLSKQDRDRVWEDTIGFKMGERVHWSDTTKLYDEGTGKFVGFNAVRYNYGHRT